ncbi:hypothetical protein BH10BAC4_BH10BAC4_14660 [soil metagenome]
MLPNTTFTFTKEPSGRENIIKTIINVDDDSVTDQEMLTYIQTLSDYKDLTLIQLDEISRGLWVALFRA